MLKFFLIISIVIVSDLSWAKSKKNKHKKHDKHIATNIKNGTIFSMCSRNLDATRSQAIIVAIETLSEGQCKKLGKNKADQYIATGWKCVGRSNEELFSCENQKASAFAIYNGVKLDHLTFTNLQKRRSMIAYINPNSNELCHEDKADLVLGGVKDAVCHKRQENEKAP